MPIYSLIIELYIIVWDITGGKYCCRGYCMDLLDQLSKKCNFTYDVYLSLGKILVSLLPGPM
jgi:hypothetical protein